jgi:hypothetical protein
MECIAFLKRKEDSIGVQLEIAQMHYMYVRYRGKILDGLGHKV